MTDELNARISATAVALMAAAREAGHLVSGDGRVSEATAAALLGISRGHLRRLRYCCAIAAFRLGLGGGRVSYRLAELAKFIETTADDESP